MKLIDLNPRWFAEPGRVGQGVVFLCPCCINRPILVGRAPSTTNPAGPTKVELAIAFSNPIDDGAVFPIKKQKALWDVLIYNVGDVNHPAIVPPGVHWKREGDTFETLSISPSVDASASGHWHGFVTAGKIS